MRNAFLTKKEPQDSRKRHNDIPFKLVVYISFELKGIQCNAITLDERR